MSKLLDMLIRYEGLEQKPYKDTKGILTIAIGRNLEERGLTREECIYLAKNDIDRCQMEARQVFGLDFSFLSSARQDVILCMLFQLGLTRFLKFVKTIEAIKRKDYDVAATEMLDSDWAEKDSPKRARELAAMMRTGTY